MTVILLDDCWYRRADLEENSWVVTVQFPASRALISCVFFFLFQNLETRASLALASQFTALDYIKVRNILG